MPYRNGRIPTPWARRQWSVFLDADDEIGRACRYTNGNPTREGCKPQLWSFVTPFAI
jgi:hypothetical protein